MIGTLAKTVLNNVHGSVVFGRRVDALSQALAKALPAGPQQVLDLGCGDGQIALGVMRLRPDVTISGVDVMLRPHTHIPVTLYDGRDLPFADGSFDYVTIVDVLHHTDHPEAVLKEAARVARKGVVVKDHLREGILAGPILRVMDWVGNRGHDVRLPYNYLDTAQWDGAIGHAGLQRDALTDKLGLYGAPLNWVFERKLHFVATLRPSQSAQVR